MKRLLYNPIKPTHKLVKEVSTALRKGALIVYPTDTIYGLGCSLESPSSIKKLTRIKQREKNKPVSIACSEISEISRYAVFSNFAYRIMKRYLPGPYTFILESAHKVPRPVKSGKGTVGVRIPDNTLCLEIIRELGAPILTTSVNVSDEEPLHEPDTIEDLFGNDIDILIDAGSICSSPSTVIDLTGNSPSVLRQGEGTVDFL